MKYEEQVKDTMEQRTIQPSANSWEKLSNRLDVETPTKNRKGFWYLGIAASIVGVLLITNLFNKDNATMVEPIIVDTEIKEATKSIDNNKDVNPDKETLTTNKVKVTTSSSTKDKPVKNEKTKQPSIIKQQVKNEQHKLVPNTNEKEIVAENTNESTIDTPKETLSLKEQKAREVVAQIQTLQKTKEVTDAEIDALLAAAQREISFKRVYNESIKTIDANALLLSVEEDIEEQSLRKRVLEMLKSGYNEVKTVVAERNN